MSNFAKLSTLFEVLPLTDLSQHLPDYAATAFIIDNDTPDAKLMLIKRVLNPQDPWSGHIALPGGRKDPNDLDAIAVAIRETNEEVGLNLKHDQFVGRLSDIQARKRGSLLSFYVRPLVFISSHDGFLANTNEVDVVMSVPLKMMLDPNNKTEIAPYSERPEVRLPAIRLPSGDILWGLTYMILQDFFNRTEVIYRKK